MAAARGTGTRPPLTAYRQPGGRWVRRPRAADKLVAFGPILIFGPTTTRNRSTVAGGAGPAARILSPSANATSAATRATRREAGVTGFDCGAGGVLLPALSTVSVAASLPDQRLRTCLSSLRVDRSTGGLNDADRTRSGSAHAW